MSSKLLSDQTCIETDDPRSICISNSSIDDISNNIGILVFVLAVAAVVYFAIATRQTVHNYLIMSSNTSDYQTKRMKAIAKRKVIVKPRKLHDNALRKKLERKSFWVRREELREAELQDEELFKKPLPLLEDCPICFERMPTLASGSVYMTCCGKVVCSGCAHAPVYDNQGNKVDNQKCSFCRTSWYTSEKEYIARLEKRAEVGDAEAIHFLGCYYFYAQRGFPRDRTKALELLHRAAELGFAKAYYTIGLDFEAVANEKKARHYFELAAMKGCTSARYNLGNSENRSKNTNRAVRHYMIAVRDGHYKSLNQIQRLYKNNQATKDEYTKALRLYQEYLGEIKCDQRDQAAAANDKYRYY